MSSFASAGDAGLYGDRVVWRWGSSGAGLSLLPWWVLLAIVGDGIERAWDHVGRGDWCRSRPVAPSTWLVPVMVDAGGYRWRARAGVV